MKEWVEIITKTVWKELYFIYGEKHIVLKTYILFEFETQRVHVIFLVHTKRCCPFSVEYRIYTAAYYNNTITASFFCLVLHCKHNLHNTSNFSIKNFQTLSLKIHPTCVLFLKHPRTFVTLNAFVCLYLSVVRFM